MSQVVQQYDAGGRKVFVFYPTRSASSATQALPGTHLSYDALDRLSRAAITGIDADTPAEYSYDALDQLTEVSQGTHIRTYAYDPHYPDELTSITDNQLGATAYSWDAQGNLASRAGQAFQFDVGNRLRSVAGSEGGYAYDAWGRRVRQSSAGGTLESFYDRAGQLVHQRDRDGGGHDELYLGGRLIAIRDFNSTGTPTDLRYQHTDALGSVIAQSGANGTVLPGTAAIYDAWGGVHGIAVQDGPGYTGQVEDALTGLVYMQQRYYDPNVGRFLSTDPVEATSSGGNLDRYWYAKDNPYRYTDPDGRAGCTSTTKCTPPPSSCSTGTHIGGGACAGLALSVIQVSPPGAPTSKIASEMVSNNPADRVAAAHSAMRYFGIKPAAGKITINYSAIFSDYGKIKDDVNEPDHGLVTLGPSAYKTWAHLGSTLGHEIEVHWNMQMLQCLCNAANSHVVDRWEIQAYNYNIENAQRFGNSAQDIGEFKKLLDGYENDLEHAPVEIYTQ